MKKLLYLLIFLPFLTNAQVNVTVKRTAATGVNATYNSTTPLDSLVVYTGALTDGYVLVYNSTKKKWDVVSSSTIVPSLSVGMVSPGGYANGLNYSAGQFRLGKVSPTKPGVMTTGTDTIGGYKRFSQIGLNSSATDASFNVSTSNLSSDVRVSGTRTALNSHAFDDWATLNPSSEITEDGYSSFDSKYTVTTPYNLQHLSGYQFRPIITSIGSVESWMWGYRSFPTHNGSGDVPYRGLWIQDVAGSGPVSYSQGIFIEDITRGSVESRAIKTGLGPVQFGDSLFGTAASFSLSISSPEANIKSGSNEGFRIRPFTGSALSSAIYASSVTPGNTNYTLAGNVNDIALNAAANTIIAVGGTPIATATSSAFTVSQPITGTTTTQSPGDNSAKLASTAYVDAATGGGTIASGTYTPTTTNGINVSSCTPYNFHYIRVGNYVSFSGYIAVASTAAGTSAMEFSLPVPSNFSSIDDLVGSVSQGDGSVVTLRRMYGETTNDRAYFTFTSTGSGSTGWSFSGHYRIRP